MESPWRPVIPCPSCGMEVHSVTTPQRESYAWICPCGFFRAVKMLNRNPFLAAVDQSGLPRFYLREEGGRVLMVPASEAPPEEDSSRF